MRGMLGRVGRKTSALFQMQNVLVLLPGVPEGELESPQKRLFDGSFASAVRAGGDGHRTRLEGAAEDPKSSSSVTFALKETGNHRSSCGGVRAVGTARALFTWNV